MGQRFLLDSNTIIDYTSHLLPAKAASALTAIISEAFVISIIVKIEVLGFNGDPDKMKKLRTFLQFAEIIPLSDNIANTTIELWKKHRKLRLGDAIIAATAMANGCVLITRNISDFKNVATLKQIDPYELE